MLIQCTEEHYNKVSSWFYSLTILGLMTLSMGAGEVEELVDPDELPPPPMQKDYGQETQTGDEIIDIIFLIDTSGSIDSGACEAFELQKQAIANALLGPVAFIPHDGTWAIGVIQFADVAVVNRSLTVIDSATTAAALASDVQAIERLAGDGTVLELGLNAVIAMLSTDAFGDHRFVVISTDVTSGSQTELNQTQYIRTGVDPTGINPDIPNARICTVFVNETCNGDPPEDTRNCFLWKLANTADSGLCDNPERLEPFYPGQIAGTYVCAEDFINPPPHGGFLPFVRLCDECSCAWINAGQSDVNDDGIPNVCDPDCNTNGISDAVDIDSGTSTDCNSNGVPDECELPDGLPGYDCAGPVVLDCNNNGVLDACDISSGASLDLNDNDIPDECERLYVDQDPNVPGPRDGSSWEKAFETLQQGLQAAAVDPLAMLIYVADGTYTPDEAPETQGDRSASFELIPGVAVVGGFAGYSGLPDGNARDLVAYETILSGDLIGDDDSGGSNAENSYHVVSADWILENTPDETTVLDGFTVTAGHADGSGAGIYSAYSSPLIKSCKIVGNVASGFLSQGGGVYTYGEGSPKFANCLIAGNRASEGGGVHTSTHDTFGLYKVLFVNCTIAANQADQIGGLYAQYSDVEVYNAIFWGNENGSVYHGDSAYTLSIANSVVEHGWPGATVMNEDPQFVDDDGTDSIAWTWRDNDYHLAPESPCIDRGSGAALLSRALRDFELDPRSQHCLPDIGADESPYEQNCNGNALCDNLEVAPYGPLPDCNGNGIPDECDISEGRSRDCDPGNGVPDECEGTWTEFDYDWDCDVDQVDFGFLQNCLIASNAFIPPGAFQCILKDHDGDWDVDIDDMAHFIANACGPMIVPTPLCSGAESMMGGGGLLAEGETGESESSMGEGLETETMDPPAAPETAGLASAVSLSVVGNPYPGSYVASRTESAGFDDPFVIWTWVEADGDLDGLQYRLRVNGGDDDDLFRLVEYAEGPLSWWDPWFDGFGELFVISGGFGTGDYGKLSVPVALDAVSRDEVVFNITRYAAAEAFPETLIGYVIEPVAPLTAGDYVFSAGGSALTGGVPLWVASPLSGTTSDDEVFTLTIEPQ